MRCVKELWKLKRIKATQQTKIKSVYWDLKLQNVLYNKQSFLNLLLWDWITLKSISKRVFFFHIAFSEYLYYNTIPGIPLCSATTNTPDEPFVSFPLSMVFLPGPSWPQLFSEGQLSALRWARSFFGISCECCDLCPLLKQTDVLLPPNANKQP